LTGLGVDSLLLDSVNNAGLSIVLDEVLGGGVLHVEDFTSLVNAYLVFEDQFDQHAPGFSRH